MINPAATWRGPVPNQGQAMSGYRLGVVHIMEGSLSGTDGWFHNPNAEVSAHFGTGHNGELYQWVDTARVAWAEAAYNGVAISVENEGNSGDSLTWSQVVTLVNLIKWCATEHGIPMQRTSDPNGSGWIGHGELGVNGGNHPDCPGSPILNQLPAVLMLANGINPFDPPSPPWKGPSELIIGQHLTAGNLLASPSGRYAAIMQTDGNFVVYDNHNPLWATGCNAFYGPSFMSLNPDGNFVQYLWNGHVLWSPNIFGIAKIVMQDDGNLVGYNATNALWSTGT